MGSREVYVIKTPYGYVGNRMYSHRNGPDYSRSSSFEHARIFMQATIARRHKTDKDHIIPIRINEPTNGE